MATRSVAGRAEGPESRPVVDLIFVGTLPPHPGGSALSGVQLAGALARGGCRVRAVGPITNATLPEADRLAAEYPEVEFHRFEVPDYEIHPDRVQGAEYRAIEGAAVREIVGRMVAEDPPEVILLGRETYSWHLPDPLISNGIPLLLRAAGGGVNGLIGGVAPVGFEERLRNTHMQVVPGRHMVPVLEGIGCADVRFVENPVDLNRFSPSPKPPDLLRRLGIKPDQLVVTHISNLKRLKRPFDLVEAARATLSAVPNAIFLIVGDGPLRDELEERCGDLGILDRFRFTGWLRYPEVPDILRASDIVVMCSDQEGMARVYLESLACERALISSDIPPAREVVEHGVTGMLFPLGDHGALAERIVELAQNPDLRKRLGRAGRRRMASHSLEIVGHSYALLLRELADRAYLGG